tara:strand:- start:1696 stop:2289 length:594 start_codon:yes stop_codon:yes gene_type:complete
VIVLDCVQGSDEWINARIGVLSASNFSNVITATGKKAKTAHMNMLIAEIFLNRKTEIFQSNSMTRGIELEPEARTWYEFATDNEVREVGLVYLNSDKKVSCSPDGLMDKKGLEIKCPEPHTHIKYLREGILPKDYIQQVQGSMLVTGLKQWDFLSYHQTIKPFLITVDADLDYQDKMKTYIDEFILEMQDAIKQIKG